MKSSVLKRNAAVQPARAAAEVTSFSLEAGTRGSSCRSWYTERLAVRS